MTRRLGKWLEDLGLGKYAETFAENEIDFDTLPHVTEADLREIGIALGARRKLLAAVAQLESKIEPRLSQGASGRRPSGAEAERRQLTVMFCDLAGSTALSERLDPEDLREVLRAYQETCAEIVGRYDGFIAKYIGDGLLVYFGYPQAHEDDARRAVRTGLEIVAAIAKLSQRIGEPLNIELAVHLGIHTGLVVAGEMGAGDTREEMAIVGETPNVAARLEQLAEPGSVLIGETTHNLIEGLFECENLGPQSLKGISEPVRVYRVQGETDARSRFEAAASRGLTPLVGREQEIGLLLDRWEQAKDGEGQVVLLSGEAGIGKSHIVQMLRDRIAPENYVWLRYQCSPYHTNSALHPIIDQLERAAGFARDDPPGVRLDKLGTLLTESSIRAVDDVPLIAAMLSIATGDHFAPLGMGAEQQKEKTLVALIGRIRGLSERNQVLIVFEDTHWIDPTSQELLDLIVEQAQSIRALVLITSRPVFTAPRGSYAHATSLTLNRLGRRLSQTMVGALTAHKSLPEDVLSQILAKTDGVPLFIEELTKTVLEAGLLKEEQDRYVLTGPLPPLAIPTSLHDSLTARLDRLGPGKEVAQMAACIGREFTFRLLAAVSPLSEAELHVALESLVAAELIFRHGLPIETTFSFKHALVRDAAYDLLLKSKRREHHRDIATALVAQFPETVATQPELIARHFTEAGKNAQAIDYWLRAGRMAAERSADAEAVGHLTMGLSLIENQPESSDRNRRELAFQLALSSPSMNTKGWGSEETAKIYERARELCELLGDFGQLLPVLFGQWMTLSMHGCHRVARGVATEMLRLSEQQNDAVGKMQGHRMLAITALFLGEYAVIERHVETSLSLYVPQRHRLLGLDWVYDPYVGGLNGRAYYQWAAGMLDQAAQSGDRAIAYARELNQISTLVYALINVSALRILARDPRTAEQFSNEALAIADEQGFPYYIAWGRMLVGCSIGILGRREAGVSLLDGELQNLGAGSEKLYRPYFLALLAELHLEGGAFQAARQELDEAKLNMERADERMFEAEICRLLGEVYLAQDAGTHGQARTAFEQAIRIARNQSVKPLELRATVSLARLLKGHDESSAARSMLESIYGSFTEGFDTPDLKDAKALLDELD